MSKHDSKSDGAADRTDADSSENRIASMLDRRQFLAGAGAAVAGSAAVGTASGSESTDRGRSSGRGRRPGKNRATVIAHRGFADTYPENTVSAFEHAVRGAPWDGAPRRGADWIELDVYPTADGDIAVFHDEDLGGLTDTEGTIYELPSNEVFSAEVSRAARPSRRSPRRWTRFRRTSASTSTSRRAPRT